MTVVFGGGHHLPASASEALPLLVCHGGPGVPSDYLFPLIGQLRRPIIFFDQLGCGRSDRPSPGEQEYSIAASVQDLVEVIQSLVLEGVIPGLIESPSQGRSPGLRPVVLVGGNGFLLCQTPFLPMPLAT